MTKDAVAWASDLNMGRIVETYLLAGVTMAVAKADIVSLLGRPHHAEISADLDVYLDRMLRQARVGDLQGGGAPGDLVCLTILANAHEPDFADRIRQGMRRYPKLGRTLSVEEDIVSSAARFRLRCPDKARPPCSSRSRYV